MQSKPYVKLTTSTVFVFSLAMFSVHSAIITEATSELEFRHYYQVNDGFVPNGINIGSASPNILIDAGIQSSVNEPTAINEDAAFVQIGNQFSIPPLPFEARRNNRSTFNAGAEGAQADFDVSSLARSDPDAAPSLTSIVERDVNNSGAAEIVLSTQDVAAEANAYYNIDRGYRIENISNNRQAFSIDGFVSFDLLSQYNGANGFASASMSVFTLFENVLGVTANFALSAAYNPNILEDGLGASVFESLTFNEPNIGGFLFSGSTTAQGNGGTTTASISDRFNYRLDLVMEAGSSFDFFTGFRQRNTVEYDPQTVNVNAPFSLSLFGLAFIAIILKRQVKKPIRYSLFLGKNPVLRPMLRNGGIAK